MQIVIDIPKDIIESAKSSPNYYPAYHFEKIWRAIANGIPLDKIKAEIADLDDADYDYEGYYKAVTDAMKVIDKYKAESEDKG